MSRRNLFILLVVSVLVIVTSVLLYKKYRKNSPNVPDDVPDDVLDDSTDLSDLKVKADEEKMQQKGQVGDWGEYQMKFIYYTIAYALLDTQTDITRKEMTIDDFSMEITDCLSCIVKNFASKYSYSDVEERITTVGRDTTFDDFFKNLYTTCECEDKLGELLTKLLKEFWIEESTNTCPTTKDKMADCIRTISYSGFDQQSIDQIYSQLSECIANFCPELLNM